MFLHIRHFLIYDSVTFDSYQENAPFWLPKSIKSEQNRRIESGNGPGSWKSEPGSWKLEPKAENWSLEAGKWSAETEKAPRTIWEVEAGAALQGSRRSGSRDQWAQYINR